MKAAIYTRVSTEDQEREGTSLDSQLEYCKKQAQDHGYEVFQVFAETYSGLSLDRPKLNELRQLARGKEIDIVIAYTLDRLSRDPVHFIILQEELERAGVGLTLVNEDIDSSDMGKLITHIKGFAAKLEAMKIRERTMRGKRTKAMSGKISSGSHAKLYGYNYIKAKEQGGAVRVVNEDEAKWVREMYRWLVEEGLSTNAITYRLRALNVPTPSDKGYWIRSTVRKILTNLAYSGKTFAFTQTYGEPKSRMKPDTKRKKTGLIRMPREEWIEIPNATPPIISESLFEAAQKQLQRNRELSTRNAKHQYLLHGRVYCKRCGRGYWGYLHRTKRGNKGYEWRRYRCSGRLKIVNPVQCSNNNCNAETLESLIWEQVELVLANPEMVISELIRRQKEASDRTLLEEQLEMLRCRLEELDKEQERLLDYHVMGFPEGLTKKQNVAINDKRKQLLDHKLHLERQIEAQQECQVDLEGLERFYQLARGNLKGLSFEDKRLALEALQIKVWIDGDSVEITGAIPMPEDDIVTMQSGWHLPVLHRVCLHVACHRAYLKRQPIPK
jgi:site-specific DNA recombinase